MGLLAYGIFGYGAWRWGYSILQMAVRRRPLGVGDWWYFAAALLFLVVLSVFSLVMRRAVEDERRAVDRALALRGDREFH